VTPTDLPLVRDAAVDALVPLPGRPGFVVEVIDRPDDDAIQAVASFATIGALDDVALVAKGTATGVSVSTDDAGFTLEDDGTVTVFDALGRSARISIPSLRRLVVRVLDVVLARAAELDGPGDAELLAEIGESRQALAEPE
jgi:hypothetical protein